MGDLLNMAHINSLPQPFLAVELAKRYPEDDDSEPCDFDRICAKESLAAIMQMIKGEPK